MAELERQATYMGLTSIKKECGSVFSHIKKSRDLIREWSNVL